MAGSNRMKMTAIECRDLDDAEPLRNRDNRRIGRAEQEIGVDLDQFGHTLVIDQFEINNHQRFQHDRAQERRLNLRAARPSEQVTHLRHHGRRNEDGAASKMQTGQQIRARTVVPVVAIGGCNQRTRVADDHSGTPESLGEQVLVVDPEIRPATGERPEPRRRPLTSRNLAALPTYLG